jgi:hypothetical protein
VSLTDQRTRCHDELPKAGDDGKERSTDLGGSVSGHAGRRHGFFVL